MSHSTPLDSEVLWLGVVRCRVGSRSVCLAVLRVTCIRAISRVTRCAEEFVCEEVVEAALRVSAEAYPLGAVVACYHPLEGFRSPSGGITWNRSESTGLEMKVPCGQCVGCRLERSRQWAVRMMHEASLHEDNCFVTLTYKDEHLPKYGSLDKKAVPDFMKRLRKAIAPRKVRYFQCGEYGSKSGRPHYHLVLFGYDFPDKVKVESGKAYPEWVSATLERLWPFGRSLLGSVTFESAAYVSRYIVDKVTGDRAELHYEVLDPGTGELVQREPEHVTMSRRPGIGAGWFKRFGSEVFPSDEVIVRGARARPPRFYADMAARVDPEGVDAVKRQRKRDWDKRENRPARLAVREQCALAQLTFFSREGV